MTDVTVRPFTSNDLQRVEEVEKVCIRYLTPLEALLRTYDVPPGGFVVAEVEQRVVGFALGNIHRTGDGGRVGHILSVAVDPAYQGRGVGARLVNRLLQFFRGEGAGSAWLEVMAGNKGARGFYLRCGFKEAFVSKCYYRMRGYTEDAVVMTRSFHEEAEATERRPKPTQPLGGLDA